MGRHLIGVDDLDTATLRELVERGAALAEGAAPWQGAAGRVVGVYFRKTSTRTRTAFSVAALRLGAHVLTYGPLDLQENTGETPGDTGRVLATMLDALVARTAGPVGELRALAAQERMAVVNAMSAPEHPTQALADLTTMLARLGRVEGLSVLYLGEGNNTAASLALALARYPGVGLDLRTPAGYGLAGDVLAAARASAARSGAEVGERHDLARLPTRVDVVYTTRWQTTGTVKTDPAWREAFAPYRVGADLLARWPGAVFMHDLPAHRGQEVEAGVLDGRRSIAFEQAGNKLASAVAVLEWALGRPTGGRSGS
jgi:ornithine carbamoyltransferase